jgi:hypothetical protein
MEFKFSLRKEMLSGIQLFTSEAKNHMQMQLELVLTGANRISLGRSQFQQHSTYSQLNQFKMQRYVKNQSYKNTQSYAKRSLVFSRISWPKHHNSCQAMAENGRTFHIFSELIKRRTGGIGAMSAGTTFKFQKLLIRERGPLNQFRLSPDGAVFVWVVPSPFAIAGLSVVPALSQAMCRPIVKPDGGKLRNRINLSLGDLEISWTLIKPPVARIPLMSL